MQHANNLTYHANGHSLNHLQIEVLATSSLSDLGIVARRMES
jgi:hypothetical protein